MDIAVKYNSKNVALTKENQEDVRTLVMESYNDMLEGKGRDYKEFFDEVENRYKGDLI